MSFSPRCLFYLFSIVLLSCSPNKEAEETSIRPVKTIVAVSEGSRDVREFPGQTKAAEEVTLSFQVSGQLKTFLALNGQIVEKGEVIAELDDRDFASQEKAARAELDRAESEFKRIESLRDSELISQSEYDQRKAARDIAEARLEQAVKALSDTKLRAPFSGRVEQRFVENYEDVTAKQPIITLQSIGSSKVVFHIPEKKLLANAEDVENYRFEASFFNGSNKKYLLQYSEFVGTTDPRSQTFEVVFQLVDEPEFVVLSGMSVRVTMTQIRSESDDVVIWLPSSAVFSDPAGDNTQYVWVVDGDDQFSVKKQAVSVGRLQPDQVEVVGGLQGGERVVTAGVHYLQENQQVLILENTEAR